MIVVKVELWGAITGVTKEIGRMYISNRGVSTDPKRGDYDVAVCRRGSTNPEKPVRKGEVLNYPRLSYNMWRLITRALLSAFPEETKKVEKEHEAVMFAEPEPMPALPDDGKQLKTDIIQCKFDMAWVGQCKEYSVPGEEYCSKHFGLKCVVTGKQANHDCDHASQFVCGAPLAPGIRHGHGHYGMW